MSPVSLKAKVGGLLLEMPLANHRGGVACLAEHLGKRGAPAELGPSRLVTVESGQQRDARRVALGRVIELGKLQALCRQGIQVGRLDLTAIATNVGKP